MDIELDPPGRLESNSGPEPATNYPRPSSHLITQGFPYIFCRILFTGFRSSRLGFRVEGSGFASPFPEHLSWSVAVGCQDRLLELEVTWHKSQEGNLGAKYRQTLQHGTKGLWLKF